MPQSAELIMQMVRQVCGTGDGELERLYSRQRGRHLAMKLLVELGGLSGREVARRMGVASTAAVSQHLQALEAELPGNPVLGRILDKASRQI